MSKLYQTKDTWELSLEDSDYDDGFRPAKKDNKPPPVQKAEWLEGDLANTGMISIVKPTDLYVFPPSAFDLVKSFAHYGGAVLSVDVESWDRDQDVSCFSDRQTDLADSPP